MKTKLFALFITGFLSTQFLNAQTFQHLRCQGEVPEDFTKVIGEEVKRDIEKLKEDKSDSRRDYKAKKEFITNSSYKLDDLLLSGQVLFGDEVSEYLGQVADEILKNDSHLRSQLRFYAVKSNLVNAFATDQGMIFVTLGLISQLENEAQLAFVLSHEIAHYTEHHTISSYVNQKTQRRKGRFKNDEDELVRDLSRYSKAVETEADSLGFIMYSQTEYALEAAASSFDVLQFSYLPFDERPFDFSSLENLEFSFPESLRLDTITAIQFDEDYDDPGGSHPAIGKRRNAINRLREKVSSPGTEFYMHSKDEFERVRRICRYEALRLLLRNQRYVEAVHISNMLSQDSPSDEYIIKQRLKALYFLAMYNEQGKTMNVNYLDKQGEISAAYFLFDNLNSNEMSYLALSNYQKHREIVKKNQLLQRMEQGIMARVVTENNGDRDSLIGSIDKLKEIRENQLHESPDTTSVEEESDDEGLSKYEKLAKMKVKQADVTEEKKEVGREDMFKIGISNWLNDPQVQKKWEVLWDAELGRKEKNEDYKKNYDSLSAYQQKKYRKKTAKLASQNEGRIGSEKIAFIDPQYYMVVEDKGLIYGTSEGREYELHEQLVKVSDKIGIGSEIITPKVDGNQDAIHFNDLAIFKDWYRERIAHEELNIEDDIVLSEQEYMEQLADRVGTDHFAITGVVMYRQKERLKGGKIVGGIMFYPILPLMIYDVSTPDYESVVYNAVYDVREGKLVLEKSYYVDDKVNKGNINAVLYDSLYKVKSNKL
jgi:Zn-dependent protease with chaperone function